MILRDYQQKIVDIVSKEEYFYLLATMRSGKTLIAVEVVKRWNVNTLIVVPPKTIPTWESTLKEQGVKAEVIS